MRGKAQFFSNTLVVGGLWLAIVLVLNLIFTQRVNLRQDLTRSERYSLSDYSDKVLNQVDKTVKATFYLSRELPKNMRGYRRYVSDILREYQVRSEGLIEYQVIDPLESEGEEEVKGGGEYGPIPPALVKKMNEKGIPISLETMENNKTFYFYSTLRLEYQGRKRTIEHLKDGRNVEVRLTSALEKLVSLNPAKVGLYAPNLKMDIQSPVFGSLIYEIWKIYPIVDLDLNLPRPISDDVEILLVVATSKFSPQALYHIDRFLMRGGKVVFFNRIANLNLDQQLVIHLGKKIWDSFSPRRRQQFIPGLRRLALLPPENRQAQLQSIAMRNPQLRWLTKVRYYLRVQETGLRPLLRYYGLSPRREMIFDRDSCVEKEKQSLAEMGLQTVSKKEKVIQPELVLAQGKNANEKYSFVNQLDGLVFPYPHSFANSIPKEKREVRKFVPLVNTSPAVAPVRFVKQIVNNIFDSVRKNSQPRPMAVAPWAPINSPPRSRKEMAIVKDRPRPLVAMVQGELDSFFIAKWKKEIPQLLQKKLAAGKDKGKLSPKKDGLLLARTCTYQEVEKLKSMDIGEIAALVKVKEGEDPHPSVAKKGLIIGVGDYIFMSQNFQRMLKVNFGFRANPADRFVMDMIEWLNSGEDLASIRSKHIEHQPLKEISPDKQRFWRYMIIFAMPFLVLFSGTLWMFIRKVQRH